MDDLVTEDELVRARRDPAFRHQFLVENLDRLLNALNRIRKRGEANPAQARQIREGVDLAVKLADRLQHDDSGPKAA
ncbi:MAG TPA: hypothetical protein VFX37_15500 [Pseudolabrys sp.]|nr:hypothetical protein [Pseudolabrys sp.]